MPSLKDFIIYSYKTDKLIIAFIVLSKMITLKNAFKIFNLLIDK